MKKEEEDKKKKLAEQKEKREIELKAAQKAMENAKKKYYDLKKAFDKDYAEKKVDYVEFDSAVDLINAIFSMFKD